MDHQTGVTIAWAPPDAPPILALCRSCGASGEKPVRLVAQANLPDQGFLTVRLLDCLSCGCAFVETPPAYDYEGQAADALSVETYAEAGAGLWPIVRTLARVGKPAGARFLEIGCGFGFGLDFAIRARGWQGLGIDPSPLAQAGRALLDVPIEHRFFGTSAADSAGAGMRGADIILASEVLEHVPDPAGLLAMLRRGLAPAGILVLTTPDLAQLHPAASFAEQVPILSVGAHLTLQTAKSLRRLLLRAGFTAIDVEARGAQLVAYASDGTLALEADERALRRAYRDYLQARLSNSAPYTPLWWGYAGRAYQEAVADHDHAAAARLWPPLRQACQLRFGFDPEHPDQVPQSPHADLPRLAGRVPKALPGLLYARALDRLHTGSVLADVAGLLARAATAGEQLNEALLALGSADLSALSAQRASLAALLALAADTGAPDCLEALARAAAADPANAVSLARRCFVGVVNAGAFATAERLRAGWEIGAETLEAAPSGAPLQDAERDTLFCLGMAALNRPSDEVRAIRCFTAVRQIMQAAAPPENQTAGSLFWAALRGECIALDRLNRHADATVLLRSVHGPNLPPDLQARLDGSAA